MLSKRELYIKLGKLKSTEELLKTVEALIINAAEKGEDHLVYVFPECYDKEAKNTLYTELAESGYYTPSAISTDAYEKLEIFW